MKIDNLIIICAVLLLSLFVSNGYAQSVTYNHDESKMQQIMVMELGSGSLTPELYYTLTHNSYKKNANDVTSVKNTLRMAAGTASKVQTEYADSIEAYMKDRAGVEALNIADRQIDLAWVTEGSKIENKLIAFKNNILYLNGKANNEEVTAWTDLGKTFDFAIKATKEAYMPNSEREKQYLAIYDEIVSSNDHLLLRIRYLTTKKQADGIVAAMSNFSHRVGENAIAAHNRWMDSAKEGNASRGNNYEIIVE